MQQAQKMGYGLFKDILKTPRPRTEVLRDEVRLTCPGALRVHAKGRGLNRNLQIRAEIQLMKGGSRVSIAAIMAQEEEDVRDYNLTEEQKAIKAKYPPVNRKYECEYVAHFFHLLSLFGASGLVYSFPQKVLQTRFHFARCCGLICTCSGNAERQGRPVCASSGKWAPAFTIS